MSKTVILPQTDLLDLKTLPRDLSAGLVVFLVALPLCLGVAVASGAPPFAGVLAGIIGGVVVGALSGSHVSVSGPAAGLTSIVYLLIVGTKQSPGMGFDVFLLAVLFAGVVQLGLGIVKAGVLAAYFPLSVIKGLLAAIGIILILKQLPHLIGYDKDEEGDEGFLQADHENTFTGLYNSIGDIQEGAALVGVVSLLVLIVWDRTKMVKKVPVPAPLVVVILGVLLNLVLERIGGVWTIETTHLVGVPVGAFLDQFRLPDFTAWKSTAVYQAGFTIAIVASLETLLNLEAVDKLDPRRRVSPPNRELVAQGVGNMACGLLGALPLTSVIVRSSVNINAGSATKRSAIVHGLLLLLCVVAIPHILNRIPLSCLAAILIMTGYKLVSPKMVRQVWKEGSAQFLPFIATVLAILFTDLMVGVAIGLAVAVGFILRSNVRRPVRRFLEKHIGGDVMRIELANQVSFLNRAALSNIFDSVDPGAQILIDARGTDYIDNDVLSMIREFHEDQAPARGIEVSLVGFKDKYLLPDRIQYVDYSTRDLQRNATPAQVLEFLKQGHERFISGQRLTRDVSRLVGATSSGQFPVACILTCIDSRTPTEIVFDLGLGDVFTIRIAGNVAREKVMGSMEYACAVAGAKLILIMGHTRCGAVNSSIDLFLQGRDAAEVTGCQHLGALVGEIQKSIDPEVRQLSAGWTPEEKEEYADGISRRNVERTIEVVRSESDTLRKLEQEGRIAIRGACYDVRTGRVEFME